MSRHDPILQGLYITDVGLFPQAAGHERTRPEGAEEYILILCRDGAGWYETTGFSGPVRSGQALWLPPGIAHSYGADSTSPWSILWVHFTGQDADYYNRLVPSGRPPLLSLPLPVLRDLEGLFSEIFTRFHRGYAPRSISYASHLLRHILGRLFFDNPEFLAGDHQPMRPALEQVIDYLLANLNKPHPLKELARRGGLSVPHFSAVFRSHFGRSPMSYLVHLRMKEACRLMDSTTLSIKEIAPQVGYNDPLYFSRVFHRIMGFSPRTYRQAPRG